MLDIRNLSVSYGASPALEDISLSVKQGECVALLGSNGAGKTTTLKTISGLLKPSAGEIEYKGKKISGTPAHRIVGLGIAQVPEGRRIFPDLTIRENLLIGSYSRAAAKKSDFEEIYALFPVLKKREQQRGGSLSGGEQQMLAFGRALMGRPEFLMLDEPSLGLAPRVAFDLYAAIAKVKQTTTVLLVEQSVHLALEVADRAYVLREGRMAGEGSAADLRNSAWLRSAYLGSELAAGS